MRYWAALLFLAGIAGLVLAQAPGDPNHTDGKKTGKQAVRDETLWNEKPDLPLPPGGGVPMYPPIPRPTVPARPCPQYPAFNKVPDTLRGMPVQRRMSAYALNGAMVIEGDRQYQDMVLCDLDRIQTDTLGGPFLSVLANEVATRSNQVTIRNKEFLAAGPHTQPGDGSATAWIKASDPALTKVYRSEPKRIPFTNYFLLFEGGIDMRTSPQAGELGKGTGAVVYIDPTQFPLNNAHQTPGHVALLHELIHAWHYAIGKGNLTPYADAATGPVDPKWVSWEEFATIPASAWQFTENAYRRNQVLPDRNCVSASCF